MKHWYAGKCRYADEIARLKAAERARHRAAEQRRKQEQERRQAELATERDRGACELARVNDTLEGWRSYLDATPEGMCSTEARERVAALQKRQQERHAEKERQLRAQEQAQERALAAQRRRARREAQAELAQAQLAQPPAPEDGIRPMTAMMVTGFSTAGAATIAAAVAGGIALQRRADINERCPNDVCAAEHEALVSDARRAAHVTTGALVVLGVGAAVGVIGLLLDDGPAMPEVDAGMLTWRY